MDKLKNFFHNVSRRDLDIPDVAGTAWAGHSAFGYDLVRFVRPQLLVELGTHGGYSYYTFCHAAKDFGTGAHCHAVDTWQGDEHTGAYGEDVFSFVQKYNADHFASFSTLQKMTFDEAAGLFEAGSIDVLHIDGLHTYEAVKHDWEMWLPKMRPGGIVLFHDIMPRVRGFGVWQLWAELSAKYPTCEFAQSSGLGVLCIGHVPADNPFLQLLFNGSAAERSVLDLYYRAQVRLYTHLYWSSDGNLSEDRSQKIAWDGDEETTHCFTIPAVQGQMHMRLDPARTPGLVEISSITVKYSADGTPVLLLQNPSDWGKLRLADQLLKIADAPVLKLLSIGDEPQITLPIMEVGECGGTLQCEICLRIFPGLTMLEKGLQQYLQEHSLVTIPGQGDSAAPKQIDDKPSAAIQATAKEVPPQAKEPSRSGDTTAPRPDGSVGPKEIDERRLDAIQSAIDRAAGRAGKPSPLNDIRNVSRRFIFWLKRRFKVRDFSCHLETHSGCITGWVGSLRGSTILAVRARRGRRVWPGQYFLHRADVAETFCGFSISHDLPKDRKHRLFLEALTSRGRWVQFARCKLTQDLGSVDYSSWIQRRSAERPAKIRPKSGPLVSVLMPVFNTAETFLRRAISSVLAQTYRNWELCIANDASTLPHVRAVLEEYAAGDPRIKIVHRERNGHICAASNSALELATGEFTALLDHDDELEPYALAEVANAITLYPEANLIYSDEDKIDATGRRYDPYFKPAWQPELLLGQNYLAHLVVYRTDLIRKTGGFRPGYEGSQDWDLALRITEIIPAPSILHIPEVLYHWRAIPGSTALSVDEKEYSVNSAHRALTDHLKRTGQKAELIPVSGGHWRVRFALPVAPPLVSVIIPTHNCASLLQTCVGSLLKKTNYPHFEIIIIDHCSDDHDTLRYFDELRAKGLKIVREEGPFNYSSLNNRAIAHAGGKVLCFLNNDIEVISSDWLCEMVSHALRPGIGVVGAMLYYPSNLLQHGGVVLGIAGPRRIDGIAGHAMKNFSRDSHGYFNHLKLLKSYSAVTGACMVVLRETFEKVGGFNVTHLAVAFNDVDFCLRVRVAGYRNVWTPFAEMYHHESASRGYDDTPEKAARFKREYTYMRATWGSTLDDDPAYNPNLTLVHEDFSLAWPPRPSAQPRGESLRPHE